MGACSIGGSFQAYDWSEGIRKVQEMDEAYYGYQDGYSGESNSCNFRFGGDFRNKASQVEKYINDRLDNMWKREGEVILTETLEYHVITTAYRKVHYPNLEVLRKGNSSPYIVASADGNGNYSVIFKGSNLKDCKEFAHKWLRQTKYSRDCIIAGRPSVTHGENVLCTGEVKTYKKTTKKTDEKHLVLAYNNYRYFGIAPM